MKLDAFPLPSVCSVPGRVGGYIRTFSNVVMFPQDPRPDEILIEDIAHALSLTCRWGGQCNRFYSVAEHSLLVAALCRDPKKKLEAQLHDGGEAYLPDMPSPTKAALSQYRDLEEGLMRVISAKFGFSWPKSPEVEEADRLALLIEGNALFNPVGSFGGFPEGYCAESIGPARDPKDVEQLFIWMFNYHRDLQATLS